MVNEYSFFVLGEKNQLVYVNIHSESIRVFSDFVNLSPSSLFFSQIYGTLFVGNNDNSCSEIKIENIQDFSNTTLHEAKDVKVGIYVFICYDFLVYFGFSFTPIKFLFRCYFKEGMGEGHVFVVCYFRKGFLKNLDHQISYE